MAFDLTPRILGESPPVAHADLSPLQLAVKALYERLDGEIAAHNPPCTNRGDCCKFDTFGHRLYVTPLEVDYFLHHQRAAGLRPVTSGACPYQMEGRCTARGHRPLGCRIFFCDPAAQEWQPALYEKYLAELKRLGEAYAVEYRYSEWLSALHDAPG